MSMSRFEPKLRTYYHNPDHDVVWYVHSSEYEPSKFLWMDFSDTYYKVIVIDRLTKHTIQSIDITSGSFESQEITEEYKWVK